MKKLFVVLIGLLVIFSCNKTVTTKKIKLPTDPELVNVEMDRKAEVMRKGGNHNPHTNPPPTTNTYQGCLKIDTDGEEVANTLWNVNGVISCANSGLSDTQIQDVVVIDKSYFAQFNVELTTDENVFNSYPQDKRRRCVVTTTNFYGNVGGVAYINSFNWVDNSPCFVFSQLLNFNTKYIADAVAHECGHTFGNYHHSEWQYNTDGSCTKINDYLWGNMIMGASYYDPNPIFGTGANSLGCNVIQNDIQVINNSLNQ